MTQEAERAEAEALSRLKSVVFGPPVDTELRYAILEDAVLAVRRTERLKAEALREFMVHDPMCAALYRPATCTCGLEAALAAYQEGAPGWPR